MEVAHWPHVVRAGVTYMSQSSHRVNKRGGLAASFSAAI
jgi:hypothetical protein